MELVKDLLPKRHPRATIANLIPEMHKMFDKIGPWEIVGSFRRGRPDSKEEDIMMRGHAKSMGYKLNEHGLFDDKGKAIPCKTEKDIYTALGLKYHDPREKREERIIVTKGE